MLLPAPGGLKNCGGALHGLGGSEAAKKTPNIKWMRKTGIASKSVQACCPHKSVQQLYTFSLQARAAASRATSKGRMEDLYSPFRVTAVVAKARLPAFRKSNAPRLSPFFPLPTLTPHPQNNVRALRAAGTPPAHIKTQQTPPSCHSTRRPRHHYLSTPSMSTHRGRQHACGCA